MQEEGRALAVLSETEGARGKGLRRIPNELFVDVPWAVGEELLDAEVAIVEEDGVGDLAVAFHLLVEDPPPHAVKAHGDDLVPLCPTDGAILGVVFHRPLARFREHRGLVTIGIEGRHEPIDGGVLVEVVGGVGLALGGGTIADVVVGIGDIIGGGQLVTNVVAVLLIVLGGAAAKGTRRSP